VPLAISTMAVAASTCPPWDHILAASVVLYQVIHCACELDEQIMEAPCLGVQSAPHGHFR
jgi:hypothetical protein